MSSPEKNKSFLIIRLSSFGDVLLATATVNAIRKRDLVDQLYVSWYDGKYDVGGDKVWDTWQIEGPDMVWYFRGQPHIHSYFHLKT